MKKIISSILLFSLFFTIAGYPLVFVIDIAEAKAAMKNQLHQTRPDKNLVTFSFNKDNIYVNWEGDDEFSYKGEMYDVIETIENANEITIHCIADKNESDIIAAFHQMNDKGNSPDHSSSSALLKLINTSFIPSYLRNITCPVTKSKSYFSFRTRRLPEYLYPILTPPPRHFC